MKKRLLFSPLFIALISTNIVTAQVNKLQKQEKINKARFDEGAALEQAKAKGLKPSEIPGYIQYLKQEFHSHSKKATHNHTPYERADKIVEKTIYIDNKPQSIGCPNSGFENYDFSGWTGQNGTYSGSQASPSYMMANGIINSGGINLSLSNTTNYHTLLTVPPTNPNYPNCVGYDSIACPNGGPLVSQIPFVSPYSLDGVSCRLLGAYGGAKVAKLKYIMSVTPSSRLFRYSYAIVLNDGHSGDPTSHQPYFKVTVRDQNNNPITSCQDFYQDATGALIDTTFKSAHLGYGGFAVTYRPWHLVSIDLSAPTYSLVTSISIEFEAAGCSASGHLGYAYVDAECSGGGINSALCGSQTGYLTAPTGYNTYQWFDNSNNPIPAPNGTSNSLTISNINYGDVYSVNMTTPGGCTLTLRDTLKPTTVSITNINSAPSCPGGNSGSAIVYPAGSASPYSYTWTATSGPNTGQIVSNSQLATGLAPGTYSVVVASSNCGQASANLSVGVSPPFYVAQSKQFCGNSTFIANPGGSAYTWYHGSSLIPPPGGINDTLYINNAAQGDEYTLVYTNPSGCRDSVKYILSETPGGNINFTDLVHVCPGNSNGSAVITLITPFPAPYNFDFIGASSIITSSVVSTPSVSVTSLTAGTYTAIVNDGMCVYESTLSIGTIQTSFSVTSTNTVLCFPSQQAVFNMNFPGPPTCGTNTTGCTTPAIVSLFSSGPFTQNGQTSYPTPYGNYYTKGRSQYLIRKAQLNAAGITAGKISSLAFNVLSMNNSETIYPDFSIKIGCTSLTALPNVSSTSQPFIAGLNQVYSNAAQKVTIGWNTYNFSQAYTWDGNSNIIVEVCFDFPGTYNYSENVSVELKQMGYTANMYHVDDNNSVCNSNLLADNGNGTMMTNGRNMLPNIRFGYCGYTSPANYTVTVSANGTITQNYGNDSLKVAPTFTTPPASNTPVVYSVTVTNPTGGCTTTQTVAILYPSLTTSITAAATTPTNICQGGNVSFGVNGATNYNWYYQQGSTQVPIATSSTINVTPPSVGINTYVVVGSSNCPSTTPDTKTVTVNVIPSANLYITPLQDVVKCLNKPFVLNTGVASLTSGNPGTPYVYSWTTLPGNAPAPGVNTASSYTANGNTTNTFVVTVSGNCAYPTSDTVVVSNLADNLAISILDSSSTCANTPFVLTSATTGGYPEYTYTWYIDNNTAIGNSPNLSYTSPGSQGNYVIALTVTDSCGYNDTDYQVINVLPPCSVIIPNVITPNGDGRNDAFKIANIEYHPNTSVTIFDRWGAKVFESTNYNNDWKADGLSDGTFFYIVDVPDDKKYNGFISVYHGK